MREMEEETMLSKFEQEVAIKKCKKMGILETKREGIPPKRHFKIKLDRLVRLLSR